MLLMVFGLSGASPHQSGWVGSQLLGPFERDLTEMAAGAKIERARREINQPTSPIVDHQVELIDEGVDFFEIFTTALFGFDIEGATERDHVAEVADGVL